MRKCAQKYGERATDVVRDNGRGTLTVASLNARGVWCRKYTVGKELMQPNAAGTLCKTTAWWEGAQQRAGTLPRIHPIRCGSTDGWQS